MDSCVWWSVRLDSLELDVFELVIVEYLVSKTDPTLLLVTVDRGFKFGLLLIEALQGLPTLEILGD